MPDGCSARGNGKRHVGCGIDVELAIAIPAVGRMEAQSIIDRGPGLRVPQRDPEQRERG